MPSVSAFLRRKNPIGDWVRLTFPNTGELITQMYGQRSWKSPLVLPPTPPVRSPGIDGAILGKAWEWRVKMACRAFDPQWEALDYTWHKRGGLNRRNRVFELLWTILMDWDNDPDALSDIWSVITERHPNLSVPRPMSREGFTGWLESDPTVLYKERWLVEKLSEIIGHPQKRLNKRLRVLADDVCIVLANGGLNHELVFRSYEEMAAHLLPPAYQSQIGAMRELFEVTELAKTWHDVVGSPVWEVFTQNTRDYGQGMPMGGVGDLWADGTIWDIKSSQKPVVSRDIWQLALYGLLSALSEDMNEDESLPCDSVGFYLSRWGRAIQWDLVRFLNLLSGNNHELSYYIDAFRHLLTVNPKRVESETEGAEVLESKCLSPRDRWLLQHNMAPSLWWAIKQIAHGIKRTERDRYPGIPGWMTTKNGGSLTELLRPLTEFNFIFSTEDDLYAALCHWDEYQSP
ncbi:MAG: hypothetical protein M1272_05535 [Firmicutes bacterium]|nr:hypothetical protein [Bacillota bacterium]